MTKSDTYLLKLTAAIAIEGEVIPAGELVELTGREARNLLHRNKAVLATERDVAALAAAEEKAAPAKAKTKVKAEAD